MFACLFWSKHLPLAFTSQFSRFNHCHFCLPTNFFYYDCTLQTLTERKDEGICVKLNINNVDEAEDTCDELRANKKLKNSQAKQTKDTFNHHMTSKFSDLISKTVAPSFSSKISGITGKKINFGSPYNIFMAKYTALVSIISTHIPISINCVNHCVLII